MGSFVATLSGDHSLDNTKVRVVVAEDLSVRFEDRPGALLDTMQLTEPPAWHRNGYHLQTTEGHLMAIWCLSCNGDREPGDF